MANHLACRRTPLAATIMRSGHAAARPYHLEELTCYRIMILSGHDEHKTTGCEGGGRGRGGDVAWLVATGDDGAACRSTANHGCRRGMVFGRKHENGDGTGGRGHGFVAQACAGSGVCALTRTSKRRACAWVEDGYTFPPRMGVRNTSWHKDIA